MAFLFSDEPSGASIHQPSTSAGLAGSAGYPAGIEAASFASIAEEVVLPPATLVRPESMAESVTRHALNPLPEIEVLLYGFDSLDLGLYVDWDSCRWPDQLSYFQKKKEESFGTDGLLDETRDGSNYLHLPSGKAPNYRFHFQFPEYHLYFAITEKAKKSPNVYASLSAETLWKHGISPAIEILTYEIECFGGTVRKIQPSRCDISIDILIPDGLTFDFLKEHHVSRSRSLTPYFKDGVLETLYVGSSSSPVRLRIYDKGKEVIKKGLKRWFFHLWGLPEGTNDVWRFEFQLRRTVLRQFNINDLHDLWQKIGGIWVYLTSDWFSIRTLDNDKTERRSIHPLWLEVQSHAEKLGAAIQVQRTFKGNSAASIDWFVAHISGCIASVAARLGNSDRNAVFEHIQERIADHCPEQNFLQEVSKRQIKIGRNPDMEGIENGDE